MSCSGLCSASCRFTRTCCIPHNFRRGMNPKQRAFFPVFQRAVGAASDFSALKKRFAVLTEPPRDAKPRTPSHRSSFPLVNSRHSFRARIAQVHECESNALYLWSTVHSPLVFLRCLQRSCFGNLPNSLNVLRITNGQCPPLLLYPQKDLPPFIAPQLTNYEGLQAQTTFSITICNPR